MRILIILIFLSGHNHLLAQQRYTISGYIKDVENGEDLIGVTIYEPKLGKGAVSNVYGFFLSPYPLVNMN
jgi:hypothetical protein